MLLESCCEALSHVLPCMCNPMRGHWIFGCLGCEESRGCSSAAFLFASLVARSHHIGTLRIAIYHRILQVCKLLIEIHHIHVLEKFTKLFINSFLILLCCENATLKFRSTMVPIHASVGVATFMLAVACCITGFTQKALDLG